VTEMPEQAVAQIAKMAGTYRCAGLKETGYLVLGITV